MKTFLIAFFGLAVFTANAQNTEGYEIRDGKLGVSINYYDTLLTFGSNKLRTFINFKTKEIELSVNPSTLRCGVDSLDMLVEGGEFSDIVFRGEVKVDYITVQSKAPQKVEIHGDLEVNDQTRPMILQGIFRDFRQAPNVQCLLEVSFKLNLADFGLDEQFEGFGNVASVEMLQTLLVPSERD